MPKGVILSARYQPNILHLQVLSILLVVGLLGCDGNTTTASWQANASTYIANETTWITKQFLTRILNGSAYLGYNEEELANLTSSYQDAALKAINRFSCSQATSVRIQLDPMLSSPFVMMSRDEFNNQQCNVHVDLYFTEQFTDVSDLCMTDVIPNCEARWTDVTGNELDVVSARGDDTSAFYLYYRRDVLAKFNKVVPETWDQLLELAAQLNGTDFDGDNITDHSVCFHTGTHCRAPYIIMAIMGSMLQYESPSQGVFFDPVSMEPMVNNPAMQRTLEIFSALVKFNSPDSSLACMPYDSEFSEGKCALTFSWDHQYRFSQMNGEKKPVWGNIGISLAPGSTHVLHRPSNTLVRCDNATFCPFSTPSVVGRINRATLYVAYSLHQVVNKAVISSEFQVAQSTFSAYHAQVVYDAHYVQAILLGIGYGQPPKSNKTTKNPSVNSTTDPAPVTPTVASSRLSIEPSHLIDLGYDAGDTMEYLTAMVQSIYHGNKIPDFTVLGAPFFRLTLLEGAKRAARPGANLKAIMEGMHVKFKVIMAEARPPELFRKVYWDSIHYQPPSKTPSSPMIITLPSPSGHKTWRAGYTAAIVVGSMVCLAIAAGVLAWAIRARSNGRTLLGAIIPPGMGPSTTLLVTDIQNSTVMWEQLPMSLMEEVLRVHHTTLRGLLDKYNGYESATEGDSFILAFHCPSDALGFAVEAQKALRDAEWPEELLRTFSEAEVQEAVAKSNTEACLSYTIKRLQQTSAVNPVAHRLQRKHNDTQRSGNVDIMDDLRRAEGVVFGRRAHCKLRRFQRRLTGALLQQDVESPYCTQEMMDTSLDMHALEDEYLFTLSGSAAAAAGSSYSCSLGRALTQAWEDASSANRQPSPKSSNTVKVWCGVRVRMGIHSGLHDPLHTSYNQASHRTQYSGQFAATAKCVADAGHGGQITLTHAAFSQLGAYDVQKLTIMSMGEHVLVADHAAEPVYQVVVPGLEPRLQSFPPLRTKQLVADGVLSAPVGMATVVFMNAVGAQILLAWNSKVTQAALHQYHRTARSLSSSYRGYVVEMSDGLFLAAFQRPEEAMAWCLAVQDSLMGLDWPQELLEHELCEPIITMMSVSRRQDGDSGEVESVNKLCSRGLRLKVGLSTGPVVDSIHGATGNMSYRGRVMNRAARIASVAVSNQVVCDETCWRQAKHAVLLEKEGIVATSIGTHTLRGIKSSTELFCLNYVTSKGGVSRRQLPHNPATLASRPRQQASATFATNPTSPVNGVIDHCANDGKVPDTVPSIKSCAKPLEHGLVLCSNGAAADSHPAAALWRTSSDAASQLLLVVNPVFTPESVTTTAGSCTPKGQESPASVGLWHQPSSSCNGSYVPEGTC